MFPFKKYGYWLTMLGSLTLAVFFNSPVWAFSEETYQAGISNVIENPGSYHVQKYEFSHSGTVDTLTIEVPSTSTCFSSGTGCPQLQLLNNAATILQYYNFLSTSTINTRSYENFMAAASTSVTAGTQYLILMSDTQWSRSPSTTYTNGDNWDTSCWGGNASCSGGATNNSDYYIGFNLGLTPGENNSVDFFSRSTPRSNFDIWVLSLYLNASSTLQCQIAAALHIASNYCYVGVIYQNTLGSAFYTDQIGFGTVIPNMPSILKTVPFTSSSQWTATAYAWGNAAHTTILAQSLPYTFTITSSTVIGYTSWLVTPAIITSTASFGAQFDCNTNSNWFSAGMCNMFLTLFTPTPQSVQQLAGEFAAIQRKPPFGYITVYVDAFQNIVNGTATSTLLSDTTYGLASMFTMIGNLPMYQYVYDFEIALLWGGFIAYLINRFRHFNF